MGSHDKYFLSVSIIYIFDSSCEGFEFLDDGSKERVNVFGVIRTRNDAAEEEIMLFEAFFGL